MASDLSVERSQQTTTVDAERHRGDAAGAPLRVAIVGTGMIAAVHRRSALLAGAELIGVLGSRPERSAEVAARVGRCRTAFASVDELAASAADVVHVCSPNATHAPYVEALVAAGKHVICEKPLAVSLAEAERMQELADRAGVVATVPFVYRYHPVVREIRARVQAGEFGPWNLLHGQYLQDWLLSSRASNWRVDPALGGESRAFADIGSHWCDLVEWVSGQRIDQVIAQLSIAVPERVSEGGPSFGAPTDGERRCRCRPRTPRPCCSGPATGVPGLAGGLPGRGRPQEPALVRARRLAGQRGLRPGAARVVLARHERRQPHRRPRPGVRLGRAAPAELPAGRSRPGLRRLLRGVRRRHLRRHRAASDPRACRPSPTAYGRRGSSRRWSGPPAPRPGRRWL